ncbi:MAG TPA: hypothetical protein VG408_09880 [Actinomycetota bacterium]|nr:hypothetical protein [Actinomycetota bacterium]
MPRATRLGFHTLLNRINAVMFGGALLTMLIASSAFDATSRTWAIRFGLLALALAYPVILYVSGHSYFFAGKE